MYVLDQRAFLYILASRPRGTLYVGSTTDLGRRVFEHREALMPGFTARYGVTRLVYYEAFGSITDARAAEYATKRWRRAWKIEMIERFNPDWADLYPTLQG